MLQLYMMKTYSFLAITCSESTKSTFDCIPDEIRTEKIILTQTWACWALFWAKNLLGGFSSTRCHDSAPSSNPVHIKEKQLDIVVSYHLRQFYNFQEKKNQISINGKQKLILGSILAQILALEPFFVSFTSTRYQTLLQANTVWNFKKN